MRRSFLTPFLKCQPYKEDIFLNLLLEVTFLTKNHLIQLIEDEIFLHVWG